MHVMGIDMTEQDFQTFVAAIKRFDAEHTASPEAARKILQEEGVLTEQGEMPSSMRSSDQLTHN
jgi:hypothetical protein